MLKKMFAFMMIFALILGTLAGCQSKTDDTTTEVGAATTESTTSAPAVVKDDLVIALSADITSLDPQGHNDTKSERVSFLLFNRLFKLNTDFEVVPDLAESYKQLSDTEWEIKIKEGVMFHNGTEMTSEDVKFSLERSLTQTKVQHVLSEVEAIEIVDQYTVLIKTKVAFAPFLYTLVHAGASILSKADVEAGSDFSSPVGSGPYTFKEWVSGDKVVLEKNESYYDKDNMGQMKTIVFRVIPEGTSRTIALETGEVDVVDDLPALDVNRVQDAAGLTLYQEPSTRVDFFGMNTQKAPFDNKLVRQAMNYAIDKEAIMIVAINNAGIQAESVLAPSMLGYKAASYVYDVEKAKTLLAEAGYPKGFEMVLWASGDERKRIAEIIQANLMDVGITASIEMYEWGTYLDLIQKGEEQAFVLGWTSNPDPDSTITPLYFSGNIGGMDLTRTNDPKIDEFIVKGREELDLTKRIAIYNEFHEYIMDYAPIVPLFVKNNIVGANASLKGVELSPQGLWNIEKIHY